MPENTKTENANDDLSNSSSNLAPLTPKDSDDARSKDVQDESAKSKSGECEDKLNPIIININSEKEDNSALVEETKRFNNATLGHSSEANRLNKISIVVNAALFLVTIGAFIKTCDAVSASKEANEISRNVLAVTRKNDSLNYSRDTANDRQQRAKDEITTRLALQAMNMQEISAIAQGKTAQTAAEAYKLQMQNIELYKKGLESEYQSDLTIKAAYLTQASPNQLIEGVCQFIATGKVPVKADSMFAYVYFAAKRNLQSIYKNPYDSLFYRIKNLDPSDEQFNNSIPTDTEIFINKPLILHPSFFDALKNDFAVIIYCGKVIYTNEATGKKRYLLFAITLPTPESISGTRSDKTFGKISIKYGDAH